MIGLIVLQLLAPTGVRIVANDPTTWPLVQASSFVYRGAFRVCPGNDNDFAFGGHHVALGSTPTSLFVSAGVTTVGEVTIPAPSVQTTVAALPCASVLHPPLDVSEGHFTGSGTGGSPIPAGLTGLALVGGHLYGTGGIYYDANNELRVSQFRRAPSLSTPSFSGFSALWDVGSATTPSRQGFVSGYITPVPPAWQTRLHGDLISGAFGQPIISRGSLGPVAVAWQSAQFSSPLIPGTPLVYYPGDHPTLGHWEQQTPTYGMVSVGTGAVFPDGTRSLLIVGLTGMGPACYGEATGDPGLVGTPVPGFPQDVYCYDPTDSNKGTHAYPYRWQVWAYDAKDLSAVVTGSKQPWDVVPYAIWPIPFPFGSASAAASLGGAAYDPVTKRFYVSQREVDPGTGYAARPIIHIFTLTGTAK